VLTVGIGPGLLVGLVAVFLAVSLSRLRPSHLSHFALGAQALAVKRHVDSWTPPHFALAGVDCSARLSAAHRPVAALADRAPIAGGNGPQLDPPQRVIGKQVK
jgi:hypothetical protein